MGRTSGWVGARLGAGGQGALVGMAARGASMKQATRGRWLWGGWGHTTCETARARPRPRGRRGACHLLPDHIPCLLLYIFVKFTVAG